jgi:hypothetical protein
LLSLLIWCMPIMALFTIYQSSLLSVSLVIVPIGLNILQYQFSAKKRSHIIMVNLQNFWMLLFATFILPFFAMGLQDMD